MIPTSWIYPQLWLLIVSWHPLKGGYEGLRYGCGILAASKDIKFIFQKRPRGRAGHQTGLYDAGRDCLHLLRGRGQDMKLGNRWNCKCRKLDAIIVSFLDYSITTLMRGNGNLIKIRKEQLRTRHSFRVQVSTRRPYSFTMSVRPSVYSLAQ